METKASLPLPTAHAFLTCMKIFQDQRSGTQILIGPMNHLPIPEFPAMAVLSIYAALSGGHGSYLPRLELRDMDGQAVWEWNAPGPFAYGEPLFPHELNLFDLPIAIPKLGRYLLALQLNGQDVAERSLWFGPREAFLP